MDRLTSLVDVYLTPSRVWSEEESKASGDPNAKPSLLGLSLRVCNPAHALESVYHVLDVLEGSPAEVSQENQNMLKRVCSYEGVYRWRVLCLGEIMSLLGLAALYILRTTFTT